MGVLDAVSASSGGLHRNVDRRNSVHAMLALSPLDFFKSVSDGESTLLLDGHTFEAGAIPSPLHTFLYTRTPPASHVTAFDVGGRASCSRVPPYWLMI